jgi:hypothetical protein
MFGKNGFQDDVIEIDVYFAQKAFFKGQID